MLSRFDTDVEVILGDGIALEYFKEWIRLDLTREEDAIDLYFALKGFKNYLRYSDAALRAQTIHRKFISLKSGTCDFLPRESRQEMSTRIHALKPNMPIQLTLFEPVWLPLLEHLKSWHAHFVCSEPFNRLMDCDEGKEDYQEVMPLAPLETMRRQKKTRHSCEASTSRVVEEKKNDIPYKHEKAEERSRFARELTTELQRISDDIARHGGQVFARDLTKPLPLEFSIKEKVPEKTLSDEELEKYADRLDRRRSDSESPQTRHFLPKFTPMVPSVAGYDFNINIPERFTYNGRNTITSGFNDTSGFCSSESAYFSSERSYRSNPFSDNFSKTPFSYTLQRKPRPPQQNCFATLPRRSAQPKIQCRLWRDGEVAPYSAELSGPVITLYQFRKTFAIRRDENLRLLFKSPCEDDSAPFQWSLISDDDSTLPLFEGKIVAGSRRYVDSD